MYEHLKGLSEEQMRAKIQELEQRPQVTHVKEDLAFLRKELSALKSRQAAGDNTVSNVIQLFPLQAQEQGAFEIKFELMEAIVTVKNMLDQELTVYDTIAVLRRLEHKILQELEYFEEQAHNECGDGPEDDGA